MPSTFLILQLTGDWQSDNLATVTNKKKVLSVEGEVSHTTSREWKIEI